VIPPTGVEPVRLSAGDFKSPVSTYSTKAALNKKTLSGSFNTLNGIRTRVAGVKILRPRPG
jgi:hypothetical protein